MRITFTGISKEKVIKKLEAAASESRAFAERIGKDPTGKSTAETALANAAAYTALATRVREAEGDALSMTRGEECNLFTALASAPNRIINSITPVYKVSYESEADIPAEMRLAVALAEGKREAAKTENM